MLKTLGFLAAGLVVGFAVATWSGRGSFEGAGSPLTSEAADQRLEALESGLAAERRARVALERQVADVEARVTPGGARAAPGDEIDIDAEPSVGNASEGFRGAGTVQNGAQLEALSERLPPTVRDRINSTLRSRGSAEDRAALFVEAGFTPERAQWIVGRTEALRMEVLQDRYEAERDGEAGEAGRALVSAETRLRNELGDADYERYLEAMGRPTAVHVNEVLGGSPALAAGLESGDEIVAYDGERVFDMSDLNRLTYEGDAGELVAIEVMRNGQPLQVYVPRGPIGIMGGGRFRGRR